MRSPGMRIILRDSMSPVITTKSQFCQSYRALIKHIFIDAHSYLGDKSTEYITGVIQSAKNVGVTHVVIGGDWKNQGDCDLMLKVANIIRSVGLNIIIASQSMTQYSSQVAQSSPELAPYSTLVLTGTEDDAQDYQNWANDSLSFVPYLVGAFNPDGWYIGLELCPSDPAWPVGGSFPNVISLSVSKVIDAMSLGKPADIWMSPYWGSGNDAAGKKVWDSCLKNLSKAPVPFMSISAIQDRVGTFDINLNGKMYKDALAKLKWHKAVCEANGWLATVNIELFAKGGGHPLWDRVRGQFDGEARSDMVSSQFIVGRDIYLGPCWEYSQFLAPQVPESLDLYNAYKKYREE
jgi:hypothetical protein